MLDAYIKDRVYIPLRYVDEDLLREKFVTRQYVEDKCSRCPYLQDRHSDICDECPGYLGEFQLYNTKAVGKEAYVGISIGKKNSVKKLLTKHKDSLKYKDKRTDTNFKHKIKFTGKLLDYQEPAVKAMVEKGYGVLKAPPRSGKCVVGDSYVFSAYGMKRLDSIIHEFGYKKGRIELASIQGAEVTSHLFKGKTEETIKVSTKNGYSIEGTPEHKLYVLNSKFKHEWKSLSDLSEGDFLCMPKVNDVWSTSDFALDPLEISKLKIVNTSSNIAKIPKKISAELARLLGYLVADGSLGLAFSKSSSRITFTSDNSLVQSDFLYCLKKVFGITKKFNRYTGRTSDVIIHNAVFRNTLCAYGLLMVKSRDKTIPHSVLSSTKKIIAEYLSAYLSCDSEIVKNGKTVFLSTASREMANQLHILLTGFGIFGEKRSVRSKAYNGNNILSTYYSIKYSANYAKKILRTFNFRKTYTKALFPKNSKYTDLLTTVPYAGALLKNLHAKHYTIIKSKGYYKVGSSYTRTPLFGTTFSGKNSPNVYINKLPESLDKFQATKINLEFIAELSGTKASRLSKLIASPEFHYEEVTYLKKKTAETIVYDVTMPETHSFICNGIVSHNTVMFTAIMCGLKKKTLILASQYDYLQQFYETMCGSDTQKPLTNIPDIESEKRKKICGICNKVEEFEKYDVCLATYQMFLNEAKGKKKLKKIKKLFGLVMVDEVDLIAAEGFLRVVNAFHSKSRMGCTGTTDRKDGRYFLINHVIGPTVYEVKIKTLVPKVKFIETGTYIKHEYKILPYAYRALAQDKKRHKLILDWLEYDLRKGRSIVVPVATVAQCKKIVNDINKRFGKEIACAFTQATAKTKENRKKIILRARKGKYKLIVGIRKMVQRGINVPAWNLLYEITPISNVPNQTQEVSRILTPLPGKPTPLIRHFLDDFGLSRGCLRTSLYRVYGPLKFKIDYDDWQRAKKYTGKGSINISTMLPGNTKENRKKTSKIGRL